jgi:hypothetical protein
MTKALINPRLEKLAIYYAQIAPRAVNKLAYKFGYHAPKDEESRLGFLYTGLQEEGDAFLRSMAKYHPDRELIMNADGANEEPNVIDLSKDTKAAPSAFVAQNSPDKSDILRLVIIIVMAFVLYGVFSKSK